jgi:hypothetical protein
MAEDIKSLTKKIVDLEKRLKFNENKIKALADNMTNPRDIERYLDVLQVKMGKDFDKGLKNNEKAVNREFEISIRAQDARDKARDKEWENETNKIRKENDKYRKEADKIAKDNVRRAELGVIQSRLATLESMVKSLMSRK